MALEQVTIHTGREKKPLNPPFFFFFPPVIALPGRLCCCYPFLVSVTEIGIVSKTIAVINRLSCWDVKIKAAQL